LSTKQDILKYDRIAMGIARNERICISMQTATTQSNAPATWFLFMVLGIGIFAISASSPLIRYAQAEAIPALLIAASRLTLSTLILTPFTLKRYGKYLRQASWRSIGLAMLAGMFLAAHLATWIASLDYTSVLVSVVFVTTSPIWVAVLEVVFLKTRLPRGVVMGLFIAVVGGLMIGLAGSGESTLAAGIQDNLLLGITLSLLGAVTVAAYWIVGRYVRSEMPVAPYIWLAYGFASISMWGVLLFTQTPVTGYSMEGYLWLLPIALLPQLVGHSTLNFAVGHLPATLVSIITQLEPIGSGLLAFILFSETPLPLQIVGSGVILAGVMMATLSQNKKVPTKESTTTGRELEH
jgi:drug/metabolite transporter (DMT)-like permease